MSFIDDYTHMAVVYLMKSKDEVYDRSMEFYQMATTHFGKKLERLRTDNDGEYVSNKMNDFCKKNRIILETTTPYTSMSAERSTHRLMMDITTS